MSIEYGESVYICTGLGSHDPARPDRVVLSYPAVPGGRHAGRRRGERLGLELVCPECGRRFRLGSRKRRRLAEAGFAEVDISRPLPF